MPSSSVRTALHEGQLRLSYQPIVDLYTGKPRGVEALLRWEHPVLGTIGPDAFLSSIAHTPLMHEITDWVLRTALQALTAWPDWTVSINVSAHDVSRPQLVDQVESALAAAGIAPERLVLELTEQAMVESLSAALTVLGVLRERGVGLSLDDFGTGFSSLLYLRDLPITELKIDGGFVSRTPDSNDDLAIVSSVAALGRSLGLTVVAEGVETFGHVLVARAVGCSAAQGFLWGAPAAREDIDPTVVHELPPARAEREPLPAALTREGVRTRELLASGASPHTIAAALNSEGLRTPRQTRWTAITVASVIAELSETAEP